MDCLICLESFLDEKEETVSAQCGHIFHTSCILHWLRENPTCPSCRKGIGRYELRKIYHPTSNSNCGNAASKKSKDCTNCPKLQKDIERSCLKLRIAENSLRFAKDQIRTLHGDLKFLRDTKDAEIASLEVEHRMDCEVISSLFVQLDDLSANLNAQKIPSSLNCGGGDRGEVDSQQACKKIHLGSDVEAEKKCQECAAWMSKVEELREMAKIEQAQVSYNIQQFYKEKIDQMNYAWEKTEGVLRTNMNCLQQRNTMLAESQRISQEKIVTLTRELESLREMNVSLKEKEQQSLEDGEKVKQDISQLTTQVNNLREIHVPLLQRMSAMLETQKSNEEKINDMEKTNKALLSEVESLRQGQRRDHEDEKRQMIRRNSKETQTNSLTEARQADREEIKRLRSQIEKKDQKLHDLELYYVNLLRMKNAAPGRSIVKLKRLRKADMANLEKKEKEGGDEDDCSSGLDSEPDTKTSRQNRQDQDGAEMQEFD